jgi:serine/threonine protein kinase
MFTDDQLPVLLDRAYRLTRQLGAGGIAVVYKAQVDLECFDFARVVAFREGTSQLEPQQRLARRQERYRRWQRQPAAQLREICDRHGCPYPRDGRCAIKILHHHLSNRPKLRRRFEAEWISLLAIASPYLVEVYGGGQDETRQLHYYAMELLSNLVPLPDVLALSLGTKLVLTAQAATGLATLHRHGIIHRDVKPDNVLVTRGSDDLLTAKIADLGIAKTHASDGLTASGAIFGTPCYIAPEAIQGSRNVTELSDVYSLGATLYHLLAGQQPYRGLSHLELLGHLYNKQPPRDLVELSQGRIPLPVAQLVTQLMAFEPAKRLPNMLAVVQQVRACLQAMAATSRESLAASMPGDVMQAANKTYCASLTPPGLDTDSDLQTLDSGERASATVSRDRDLALRPTTVRLTQFYTREPGLPAVRLIVVDRAGQHTVLDLATPRISIGRAASCTIQISDPKLSKQHAEIRHEGAAHWLYDLSSKNGTFVGGQRITRHELVAGDPFKLGDTTLHWQLERRNRASLGHEDQPIDPGDLWPSSHPAEPLMAEILDDDSPAWPSPALPAAQQLGGQASASPAMDDEATPCCTAVAASTPPDCDGLTPLPASAPATSQDAASQVDDEIEELELLGQPIPIRRVPIRRRRTTR